ncbi:hypothetical protein GCM10028807_38460 [Spirosoma daeguense]
MTETELTDRLREAIVLDGPDVWRTNGYLQDAQQAGIPLADALKRANEIGQEVANNNLLFQNIQARITRLAEPSRRHLIDQDLARIINAATSLNLSADFVRNRWVPTVLQRIAPPPVKPADPIRSPEQVSVPETATSTQADGTSNTDTYEELLDNQPVKKSSTVAVNPAPAPEVPTTPEPLPTSTPPVVTSTESFFSEIDRQKTVPVSPEPAPIVRSFTATPARIQKGQTVTLDWEVENLLAVTIDDLGEGLSPKNRGWVKPSKSMDYTLFDANNNPLSTVRIEVIQPDRSGIYGVLFALALLAIIYWFIKGGSSKDVPSEPRKKAKQTSGVLLEKKSTKKATPETQKNEPQTTDEVTDSPTPTLNASPGATSEKPVEKVAIDEKPKPAPSYNASEESPTEPAEARQGKYQNVFGNKPFDKVELGPDEKGWRRARSHGRWGFVNEADEWVIKPQYEAVTPFRDGQAKAFLDGETFAINRAGQPLEN